MKELNERSESVTERVDEEEWSVAECSRSETGVDWFTERSPWRGGVEERSESATGIKKGLSAGRVKTSPWRGGVEERSESATGIKKGRGCAGERVSE